MKSLLTLSIFHVFGKNFFIFIFYIGFFMCIFILRNEVRGGTQLHKLFKMSKIYSLKNTEKNLSNSNYF